MGIKTFLSNFFQRQGLYIFMALLIDKFKGFILVLMATRLISKSEFGSLIFANSFLVFSLPFIGMGIYQGLLRYGSIANSQYLKLQLFKICLQKGLLYSLFMTLALVLLSPLLTAKLPSSFYLLLLLSGQLISFFLFEMLSVYTRLIHCNKLFTKISLINNISLIGFSFIFMYHYGAYGYALVLVMVPLITSIWFILKLNILKVKVKNIDFDLRSYLKYGMSTSLGNVISTMLYTIDLLLIGYLLQNENLVAEYKVASLLPFNLLFISRVFMTTDFVKLANKYLVDPSYLKDYYYSYLKIFILISICSSLGFYIFGDLILLLFGKDFRINYSLMMIFVFGMVGGFLFRIPMSDLISAMGYPKVNLSISLITIILNILGSYYMITHYGIEGAAMVTSILMWLSGLMGLAFFRYKIATNKS